MRQDGRDAMRRTRVASRYAWVTLSLPVFFFVMPSGSNWGLREILAKMIVLESYQKRRTINFYGCFKSLRSLAWVILSLAVFYFVTPFYYDHFVIDFSGVQFIWFPWHWKNILIWKNILARISRRPNFFHPLGIKKKIGQK